MFHKIHSFCCVTNHRRESRRRQEPARGDGLDYGGQGGEKWLSSQYSC